MVRLQIDLFRKVIRQCLAPGSEQFLLIGDRGSLSSRTSVLLTEAFAGACSELGLSFEVVYQSAKTRGQDADPVVVDKLKRLPKGSVVMMNFSDRMGGVESLGHSLRSFLRSRDHRFTSASSLGGVGLKDVPVLLDALDIDYRAVHRRTERIKRMFDNGCEAHVSTKAGTDVVFCIESMNGYMASGLYRSPGSGGNLPGSEAYIAPYKNKVEGVVVIDGSARLRNGTHLISDGGIRLDIRKGSIVSMNKSSSARLLENTLRWAHRASEHPWGVRRIGELGVGTNPRARIIGSTIVDEKVLGSAHVAIGSNQWFGGSIFSIIHLDQVMRDATVRIDGRVVR